MPLAVWLALVCVQCVIYSYPLICSKGVSTRVIEGAQLGG